MRTVEGWLPFQEYFVARRCQPVVQAIDYQGADRARVCTPVLELLRSPALRAVILCPSNPLLSIEPMLAIPELRRALTDCAAPVIAVSPIVAGEALKGPTAKMLRELGRPVDALEAARRYADLVDGYIVDERDAALAAVAVPGVRIVATNTVMDSLAHKQQLAQACVQLADALTHEHCASATPP